MTQERQYKNPKYPHWKLRYAVGGYGPLYHVYEEVNGNEHITISKGNFTDDELLALGFVELPTTDTGKQTSRIVDARLAYCDVLNRKGGATLEDFSNAILHYMPKPVEPVGLDELIGEVKGCFGMDFPTTGTIELGSAWRRDNSKLKSILAPYITGKQEQLVPLDVDEIYRLRSNSFGRRAEILNNDMYMCFRALDEGVLKDRLETILSKYGVQEQEAPVTSTIEELADNILFGLQGCGFAETIEGRTHWHYKRGKYTLLKLLSSLSPIGNKRTRKDIEKFCEPVTMSNGAKADAGIVIAFVNHVGLLQE